MINYVKKIRKKILKNRIEIQKKNIYVKIGKFFEKYYVKIGKKMKINEKK